MADLFISYSSKDRAWAKRLYDDLKLVATEMDIFWDRDPASLPPGKPFRDQLNDKATTASHFVVLWSENAKASNEVGPEIQMFDQNKAVNPRAGGVDRTLFYVPLEGQYGPLEALQGFAELRRLQTYTAGNPDDLSKLDVQPHGNEWNRMVTIIGDTVLKADAMQPVTLAVVAMNASIVDVIDPFLNVRLGADPSLQDVLDSVGLTLADAKSRYHATALDWRPFGTTQTVMDFMRDLRAQINGKLEPKYRFRWDPCDLVGLACTNPAEFRQKLAKLGNAPSVVVIDPISLHNLVVSNAFLDLLDYAQKEQSVIVSLSPVAASPSVSRLYQALRGRGKPVLNGFFEPQVPAKGVFARCGINVQHPLDVERLIRASLGRFYLTNDPLVSGA